MMSAAILWSVAALATACVAEAAIFNGSDQEALTTERLLKMISENRVFGLADKPVKTDDMVSLRHSLRSLADDRNSTINQCATKPSDESGTPNAGSAGGCSCRSLAADEASLEFLAVYLNDRGYRKLNSSRQKLQKECAKMSALPDDCDNATGSIKAPVTLWNLHKPICQELTMQTTVTSCAQQKVVGMAQGFCQSLSNFGLNLFKKLAKQQNFIMSPFSISTVISMIHAGADGLTKKELDEVLFSGVPAADRALVHNSFAQLLRAASVGNNDSAVNRLYLQAQFPVHHSYQAMLWHCFNSDLETVEKFDEVTRQKINQFIEHNTGGMIKDLIDEIPQDTVMMVVNALFFKGMFDNLTGAWKVPFDPQLTKPGTFYTTSLANVSVPMMHNPRIFIRHSFNAKLNAEVLILPYAAGNISMVVMLPSEPFGLVGLVEQLTSSLLLSAIKETMQTEPEKVSLTFPKFDTTTFTGDLRDALISLGIKEAFRWKPGAFAKISSINLRVSAVFHAASIEVDERGTTASAATGGQLEPISMPLSRVVDHPFLYAIIDESTCECNVLFIGQITNPSA